ncbi:MAG: DUF4242 domain-containing protein [Dehalococcoidia bacterium]
MARFIVVHKTPFTREELIARAKAFPGYAPKNVQWRCSYCDFTGKTHFCEWEAPDEKVLRKVMELTKAPFERIHLVQRLDVVSGEFES